MCECSCVCVCVCVFGVDGGRMLYSRSIVSAGEYIHVCVCVLAADACAAECRLATFSQSISQSVSQSVTQGRKPQCTSIDSSVQLSTAQHSTAQHSTAQHSTAQHSTAQHSMPLRHRELHTVKNAPYTTSPSPKIIH
ncbi:MAG TPA: hypothetical protein V6C97_01315 [Oculatellaceae cyanobacterium]